MSDYIAAIDLGTTKIVGLIGKKTEFGRYQITANYDISSQGIQRGEVQNVKEVSELLSRVVDEMRSQSQVDFSEVYVGIAGQHIKCASECGNIVRSNANAEITQEEVDNLRKKMFSLQIEPGENILHVIPQSYNVDEKMDVHNPIGMLGHKLEGNFHIVIGKTQASEIIERCVNNQDNLKLKKLILEPLASSTAVLTDEEKEAGVAMVDIGGGTTDLMIFYDNIVRHSAVIPFGGNVITEDIREGCGVLRNQAESMKVQFGSCLGNLCPDNKIITIPGINGREPREVSFRSLSQIIDARMEEILGAVMFEIEQSGFADKLNMGIVFTGGGSLLGNLTQFTKYKIGMDARIGHPTCITTDSDSMLSSPIFSTAIGLIAEGFKNEQRLDEESNYTHTNFAEEEEPKQSTIDIFADSNFEKTEERVAEPVVETVEETVTKKAEPRKKNPISKFFKSFAQDLFVDSDNINKDRDNKEV